MARAEIGAELPTDYPHDFEFRMARRPTLDFMCTVAEMRIWPFALQRQMLASIAREVFGGGEVISVVKAIDLGAATYEATLGYVPELEEKSEETEKYNDELAKLLALRGLNEFIAIINMNESMLKDRLLFAAGRMEADAPNMNDVVSGVVESHLREPILQQYARFGAAAMRGLHIMLDRRIARNVAYVDEGVADPDNELSRLLKIQDM